MWEQEGTEGGKFQEGNKAKLLFKDCISMLKIPRNRIFVLNLGVIDLELIGKQDVSILV